MASSEGNAAPGGSGGAAPDSALFSNIRGSLFGGQGSPQRVVSNIRGFLSNRLSNITPPTKPDTGKSRIFLRSHLKPPSIKGYIIIPWVRWLILVSFSLLTSLSYQVCRWFFGQRNRIKWFIKYFYLFFFGILKIFTAHGKFSVSYSVDPKMIVLCHSASA